MSAYYNELEPYAAQWLRNLIAAGHIAPGEVDERDIRLVRPEDLRGYTQCHFFAGIGVWSYALRLAGWPDDREVWTGSCPCQPFSNAGQSKGHEDERHLWPTWNGLIGQQNPVVVFGEQVADGDGKAWLDVVCADLESRGYAIGAVCPAACCVGAPHERQRTYFVANTNRERQSRWGRSWQGLSERDCVSSILGDANEPRLEGQRQQLGLASHCRQRPSSRPSPTAGFWGDSHWLPFTDGKARPVEPSTFPLAHGAPARMGRLRAYGNAIVAPLAQAFIEAYMDCEP